MIKARYELQFNDQLEVVSRQLVGFVLILTVDVNYAKVMEAEETIHSLSASECCYYTRWLRYVDYAPDQLMCMVVSDDELERRVKEDKTFTVRAKYRRETENDLGPRLEEILKEFKDMRAHWEMLLDTGMFIPMSADADW